MKTILLYCALATFTIITATTPDLIGQGYHTDKVLHVFVFSMAMVFFTFKHTNTKKRILYAVILLFFGISIELVQTLTPDRNAELSDIVADIIGIIYGFITGYFLRRGYYNKPIV